MYLKHYDFRLMPFEIGPDTTFLWLGEKHEEAFAKLKSGVYENKGFVAIIGEPGTGKTTLLNALAETIGDRACIAKIHDPALSELDFFNFAAKEFKLGKTFDRKSIFLTHLEKFVQECAKRNTLVVLVIDEAQRLSPDLLEEIQILWNVGASNGKAITCIFAGQSEFLATLEKNSAVSQRVFFTHIIQPFDEKETQEYIRHRLKVAGAKEPIFTVPALKAIYRLSKGNPRLINMLCDHALLAGYALNQNTIGPKIIEECIPDTLLLPENVLQATPAKSPGAVLCSPPGVAVGAGSDSAPDPVSSGWLRSNIRIRSVHWAMGAICALLIVGILIFESSRSRSPVPHPPVPENRASVIEDSRSAENAHLKEAVSQLERVVSDREQRLLRFEHIIRDLETRLAQEKTLRDKLDAELLSREGVIADLHGKLDVLASTQARIEAEGSNVQRENLQLRTQIQELRKQNRVEPATSAPSSVLVEKEPEPPNPADIIDFVLKKKPR